MRISSLEAKRGNVVQDHPGLLRKKGGRGKSGKEGGSYGGREEGKEGRREGKGDNEFKIDRAVLRWSCCRGAQAGGTGRIAIK